MSEQRCVDVDTTHRIEVRIIGQETYFYPQWAFSGRWYYYHHGPGVVDFYYTEDEARTHITEHPIHLAQV